MRGAARAPSTRRSSWPPLRSCSTGGCASCGAKAGGLGRIRASRRTRRRPRRRTSPAPVPAARARRPPTPRIAPSMRPLLTMERRRQPVAAGDKVLSCSCRFGAPSICRASASRADLNSAGSFLLARSSVLERLTRAGSGLSAKNFCPKFCPPEPISADLSRLSSGQTMASGAARGGAGRAFRHEGFFLASEVNQLRHAVERRTDRPQ